MRGDYQFASVSATATTATVAPALSGHRVRLVACTIVSTAAANVVSFQSGGTFLTGEMTFVAGSVFTLPFAKDGWMQTVVGQGLSIEVTGTVAGCIVYEYLPDDA